MVALSFVHFGMLGGLALGSLPIIIHILNRRRFKMMEWAAMDFLLKAAVRNRRRVRLENLLLLLLRVLVVLLLILAVSRPYTKRGAFASLLGAGGSTERVILLDDSHSMRAGAGNLSALERAKKMLKSMVSRLHDERSSDRVTVILGSTPNRVDDRFNRVAIAGAHYDRMLQRIDKLRPSDGSLDIAAAVEAIERHLLDEDRRVVLYVMSDFRSRDWLDPNGSLKPRILESLGKHADRIETHFLDVGAPPVQNLAITELRSRERAVVAGVPAKFIATVKNHGPDPASNISVQFRFPNSTLSRRIEGTLLPGETAQIAKEFTFRKPGPAVVSAQLPSDVLPADGTRRLTLRVRRSMRFLLVNGEPSAEAYRSEIDYLAAALSPPGPVESGVEVDEVLDREFSGRELEPYDGVFLCNVYRLPKERIARLEEFVQAGGGLVFFLGDQIDPDVYNATFFGRGPGAGKGLLPLMLREVEGTTDDYVHFSPPAFDHPIIQFLRGINEMVLRTVSIKRFVSADAPLSSSDARVIMSYSDENASPALAEKSFGKGRVLMYTTAADMEWSDLPSSPLYLALLQETARYVVRPDPGNETLRVGAPIIVKFDAAKMRRRASLAPPEDSGAGQVELTLAEETTEGADGKQEGTGRFRFVYEKTDATGVYTIKLESPDGRPYTQPFAVNIEPTEGDLRRAEVREISASIPNSRVENTDDSALLDLEESDRSEFWRLLVFALVGCAMAETLLAWRFGHHKKSKIATEAKQVFVR